MQGTAFQGKQLGLAFEVWKRMLGDRCTIMMGMSGAMVPAGMRRLVVRMIEYRLIDCLVSTGANFFHDLHETMGNFHYQGSPAIDDVLLAENLVDRMYDVLADEEKFRQHDQWIGRFAASLDQSRPYTTREFLYLLGLELGKHCKEDGIVSAAAKAGIPLYCPAIADSSIGIGIAANRYEGGNRFTFDVIGDVVETAANRGRIGSHRRNLFRRRHAQELRAADRSDGHHHEHRRHRPQVCHSMRHGFAALGRAVGLHVRRGAELGQDRERRVHGDVPLRFHHRDADLSFGAAGASRIGGQSPSAQLHAGPGTGQSRHECAEDSDVPGGRVCRAVCSPAIPRPFAPRESWLPDAQMQAIAAENNLAETAFFVRTAKATNCAGSRRRWKSICAVTRRWHRRQ